MYSKCPQKIKKKHSRKIYGNNDPIKSCVNMMHEKVCDVTHIITRPNFNNKRLQIVFGIQIWSCHLRAANRMSCVFDSSYKTSRCPFLKDGYPQRNIALTPILVVLVFRNI
jgi:hypothetical protein